MKRSRILLVDDDRNVVEGLRRALHKEPFEILCACSAEEGLGLLSRESVDVVVSDEEMPGTPGVAFLKDLCLKYPETVRIILTGKASLDTAIRAINEGGVCRFFVKPVNPQELAVSIHQELGKRDLMAASKRLLQKVRQQAASIRMLRRQLLGTEAGRELEQVFEIEEPPEDVWTLIDQICRQLETD
jgi:two-component system, probable response regulator PhcQ